jgi:hypothetical protein
LSIPVVELPTFTSLRFAEWISELHRSNVQVQ